MERLYEGLFLVDAADASKSWSDLESHFGSLFSKHSAKLEYSERWADKKLAYPVKGVTRGTYYLVYFRAPSTQVNALRRDAELSERILRLLITQEDWTETEMNQRKQSGAQRNEGGPRTDAPPRSGDEHDGNDRGEHSPSDSHSGEDAPTFRG